MSNSFATTHHQPFACLVWAMPIASSLPAKSTSVNLPKLPLMNHPPKIQQPPNPTASHNETAAANHPMIPTTDQALLTCH